MDVASGFSTKVEIPQGAESATIQLTSAEELNNITVTTEDPATAVTFTSRMEYGSTKGSRHVYTGMLNTTNEVRETQLVLLSSDDVPAVLIEN